MFASTAPIEIDVRVVRVLREPGCRRLSVTTAQDAVLDFNREARETRPSRKGFTYQLNYCRDRRIPEAGAALP